MTSLRSWSVPLIFVYLFSTLLIAGCGKPTLDTIKVEPVAATLTVGQSLHLRATGLDAKGQPIEGLNFTWSVLEDSGRIDATGLFTAFKPGTATVTVALGTVQSTATLTVEREQAAQLVAAVEPPEVTTGQQVHLTVTVQNAEGRGIATVPVQAQPTSPDTAIDPPSAPTDANGQATFTITVARQAMVNQVQLSADGQQTVVAVQGQPGPPATVRVTATATEVVAGEEAGLQVVVQDEAGNPIPNQQVSFTPLSNGTTVTPAQAPTNPQGEAGAVVRTSTSAGVNRIRLTTAELPPQDVEIRGTASAPSQVTLQTDSLETVASGTVTVTVQVRDAHGNAVADVPVQLTASPTAAAIEATTLRTDAQGTARVRLRTSPEAAANTVEAQVAVLPPAQLTVTGQAPTVLRLTPQTASVEMLATQRVQATAADARGHTVDVQPAWKVVGEIGTIDAEGTFTAAQLGSGVVMATYADLTAGAQLTVVPGAVAQLELTPEEATLVAGTTHQFQVKAFNAQRSPLEVRPTWTVTNDVGTIDASGLFTATKAGGGEVGVTVEGTTARARVTVTAGELATLRLSPERVVVQAGEEVQVQASGHDATGNLVPIAPTWRLTANLGELDPAGVFRAQHAGQGRIRAEVDTRPVVAEIPVEVVPAALHRIEVQPQTLTLSAGEELPFTATGSDAFGNTIPITPRWELTADLGTISATGTFVARSVGAALVQAWVDQLSGQASVLVKPSTLTSLTIEPAGPLSLTAGDATTLAVSGYDAYGNTVAVSPTWSQTAPLGTLSPDGSFRAEKVGRTALVVQSNGQSAAVQVTITPGKLTRMAISPADVALRAGDTLRFQTTGFDAYENEVEVQPTWRVVNDIGEISPTGEFTAMQAQTGQVVATAAGIAGQAQVTVHPGPLTLLKVTPEDLRLRAGEAAEMGVVGYDTFGNVVPVQPVWQVTAGMGSITPAGILTAQKAGAGRVVVAVGHLAAVAALRVEPGDAVTLRLDPASARVVSGRQQQFAVQGFDLGGNQVPVEATWEVRGNMGTIDPNGLFTATLAEMGAVVARADPLMVAAEVHVEPGEVTTLRLAPETATLKAGEQLEPRSEAFDAAGNRVPTAPAWTVTEGLGTVSAEGVFHAQRAGSGKLMAALGKAQQAMDIQVEPGPLATLALVPASLTTSAGTKTDFTTVGSDAYGNTVPVEPTWSLQGMIGQIDPARGTFQATTAGAGTVVAVVGTIAGLAPVSVEPGTATRLQIAPPTATLAAGDQASFTVTAFDAYHNITTADVVWSLTAPLGELANGTLQARRAGTTALVVSAGPVQARTTVQVQPGPVVRLQVTPLQEQLLAGKTLQFRALGYDAYDNAREVDATWSLTGEVGQLDATGGLTAGKQGIGQVTARVGGLAGQAHVTVVPGSVQRLVITPGEVELASTTTQEFTVTGLDAGGNAQSVPAHWAVTQGLGHLEPTGRFTAMQVGEGTVVGYTDGLVSTAEVRVTPGPVALLFVTPQPTTMRAGQTVAFQAQGFDAHRNAVPTVQPHWSVHGDLGTIDRNTGVFTATHVGRGKVQAAVAETVGSADVAVQPSMPDTEHSRLVASRVTVLADGKSAADIIVLVRDRFGNAVADAHVTLVSSRGDDIEQPGPSNAQGIAIGRIRSRQPGLSAISAVVESVLVNNALRLTFNQPGTAG